MEDAYQLVNMETIKAEHFTLVSDDYVVSNLLAGILGNEKTLFDGGESDSMATVIGNAFGIFNARILFFGAVILAYVTIFGVMNQQTTAKFLAIPLSMIGLRSPIRR